MPVQEVAANKLQRSLKSVQAALETRQAAIFGEEVSFHQLPAYHMCAPVGCSCGHSAYSATAQAYLFRCCMLCV